MFDNEGSSIMAQMRNKYLKYSKALKYCLNKSDMLKISQLRNEKNI